MNKPIFSKGDTIYSSVNKDIAKGEIVGVDKDGFIIVDFKIGALRALHLDDVFVTRHQAAISMLGIGANVFFWEVSKKKGSSAVIVGYECVFKHTPTRFEKRLKVVTDKGNIWAEEARSSHDELLRTPKVLSAKLFENGMVEHFFMTPEDSKTEVHYEEYDINGIPSFCTNLN